MLAGLLLFVGPRERVTCELDAAGDPIVLGSGEPATVGICEQPTAGTWGAVAVLCLVAVAVWILLAVRAGRTGSTPGKSLTGLRLVDATTGEVIGAGRAVGREVLRSALWIIPILGVLDHLWPLWDRNAQAIHDKAVGSVVVPASWSP